MPPSFRCETKKGRQSRSNSRRGRPTDLVLVVLSLPAVDHRLGSEVVEVVEVEALVLAVELLGPLLSLADDGVDVLVDEEAEKDDNRLIR